MNTTTTLEMEVSMMQYLDIRKNLVVTGVHWGLFLGGRYMHECDVLSLTKTGYATEVEIKISASDLIKDKKKWHGHKHNHIKYLYFAVPEHLKELALTEIPERAGLYVLHRRGGALRPTLEKEAIVNKDAVKWEDKDRLNLARLGAMRILGLKRKILNSIK